MHQAAQSSEQVLCALHGGAGTGKSQSLVQFTKDFIDYSTNVGDRTFLFPVHYLLLLLVKQHIIFMAVQIHRAFMIAANQKLEHRALSWVNLNILRKRFHGIEWILLDEFSMVGNTMLN